MTNRLTWLGGAALMMLLGSLAGCGGGGSDNAIGLSRTASTVIGNTIFTDDVVTDGNWMVWEGRKQNFIFNNGTTNIDLTKNLDPKYNLGTNNDDWGNILFDGRYVVFFADDVTDSAPAQLFSIDTEDSTLTPKQIGDGFIATDVVNYDEIALDNGIVTVLVNDDVFYYNSNTATQGQLTDDGNTVVESQLTVSGNIVAFVGATGHIQAADVSAATPAVADIFTPVTGVASLQGKGGTLTWADNTYHVYYSDGTVANTEEATVSTNTTAAVNYLAMNNTGTIAWQQGSDIVYRTVADAAEVNHPAVAAASFYYGGLFVGTDFIAWNSANTGYSYEISLYNISEETTNSFSTDDTYNFTMWASGSSVFWYINNENLGSYPDENPSKYLYKYDTTTSETSNVSQTAYQMIEMDNSEGVAVGGATGQVAWRGHAQNRTLYATSKSNIGVTYALTPNEMDARQPAIDNGILVFKGFDRSEQNGTDGEEDMEIYYIDLNGDRTINRITNNVTMDKKPNVSGRLISWKDDDYYSGYKAFYYNLDTKVITEIAGAYSSRDIRNDGRFIAFRDNNNDLYYYDTQAETPAKTAVAGAVDLNSCPNISKGIVTWNNNGEIWYMDLTATTPTPVDVGAADSTYSQPPTTDGRFIVWGGDSGGNNDYTIKYYDTQAATPAVVELTATTVNQVCIPRLSNGIISFAAVSYGEIASVDGDREMFAYDLNATAPEIIQVTDNDLWDSQPDIVNGAAIWRTGGGDNNWNWSGKIAAAILF